MASIVLVIFLAILDHYEILCDPHGNKRFLFDPTPGTQTTPDPVFMAMELKYLHDQVHQLSDTNIQLSVHNSLLTSQLQSQSAIIQTLKANLTNLENTRSHENADFKDRLNKMETALNDSKALETGLTLNVSSCLLNNKQLEDALITSNNKLSALDRKLNESLATQDKAVQTAVEECHRNESVLSQQLQNNMTSLQQNCSHQLTLLTDNVHQLQTESHAIRVNWTSCVDYSHQLQSLLIDAKHKNQLCDRKLNEWNSEKHKLTLALLQCQGKKRDCALDLVFLVDESGSIGLDNFEILKDFMIRIIQHLDIGPYNNQVGMATYSTAARPEFDLDTYMTKDSLLQAVQNISFTRPGLSFMSRGLSLVAEHYFNGTHGDRAGHPNVLVVLTDGEPLDPARARQEAAALENHGVEIFVVGISTAATHQHLVDVASDSNHVLSFSTFGDLDNPALAQTAINKLMSACHTRK